MAEDAVVAVSVVVTWSVVAVAVLWHVHLWAAVVQSDLVVLVVVHVLFSSPGFSTKSHHHFSHFLLSR